MLSSHDVFLNLIYNSALNIKNSQQKHDFKFRIHNQVSTRKHITMIIFLLNI